MSGEWQASDEFAGVVRGEFAGNAGGRVCGAFFLNVKETRSPGIFQAFWSNFCRPIVT